jgi:hypothetical protein
VSELTRNVDPTSTNLVYLFKSENIPSKEKGCNFTCGIFRTYFVWFCGGFKPAAFVWFCGGFKLAAASAAVQ